MPAPHTLETFTAKAREIHGDRYEYIELVRDKGKPGKVRIRCKVHGESLILMNGHITVAAGCRKCGFETLRAKKQLTFEQFTVKAKEIHGDTYEYSKLELVNGKSVATIVCKIHGEFTQGAAQHLMGQGCKVCGNIRSAKKRTLDTAEFIARARETHGDTYDYNVEESTPTHLSVTCRKHGEFKILKHGHAYGQGCSRCADERNAEQLRLSLPEIEAKAREVHGDKYNYVSLNYTTGEKTIVLASCREHGLFEQTVTNHLNGAGCPPCGFKARGEKLQHTLETFIPEAKKVHGEYAYEYKNMQVLKGKTYVTYTCFLHGEVTQNTSAHLRGQACPSCYGRLSRPHLAIRDVLTSIGAEPEMEFRFPNTRKFFDVVLHSTKVLIEYNGNYWHSSEHISRDKHLEKSKLAEANGYRCIHIRSDEWANKRTAVEYLLKSAAGKVTEKVYARKTQIVRPSKVEASRLLDTYHIQGSVLQGEFYGLEEAGQLVAVMVFSRNTSSRREKASDSHVELTRYVTCKQVVGGFTKLLNHFLKENPQVNTIASYSDVRIFQGGVYEKAGFAKMHTTPPDYMYLEGDALYHKANYQKSKLAKRFGAEACEGKTERQITEEQGIFRVYDCGKTKWLYTRK